MVKKNIQILYDTLHVMYDEERYVLIMCRGWELDFPTFESFLRYMFNINISDNNLARSIKNEFVSRLSSDFNTEPYKIEDFLRLVMIQTFPRSMHHFTEDMTEFF